MSIGSVLLFVHIFAASFLVGHSLLFPLFRASIRTAPTLDILRQWLRLTRDAGRAAPIAAVTLLATGLPLASGRWSEAWLLVACALFVLNAALAGRVVKATGERLGALAGAASGTITPELDALRRASGWNVAADVLLANDVAALFLMSVQPGVLGSVAAALVSNAAMVGFRALRSRAGAPEDCAAQNPA